MSRVQCPASIVQHPGSSFQNSASGIQYPESSIQGSLSRVQCPESSIQLLYPGSRNSGMPHLRGELHKNENASTLLVVTCVLAIRRTSLLSSSTLSCSVADETRTILKGRNASATALRWFASDIFC